MNIDKLFASLELGFEWSDGLRVQISQYFAGNRTCFEYDWSIFRFKTVFQERVLRACAQIPYGETRTYSQIAAEIGAPLAVRAVGTALKNNPYPIIIPCHRVIKKSGGVGEYVFGSVVKSELLAFEFKNFSKKS